MKTEGGYDRDLLKHELNFLRKELKKQEAMIDLQLRELYDRVQHPVPYIKRNVKELVSDTDLRSDLLKAGLNLALSFLAKKLMRSSRVKNILGNLLKPKAKQEEQDEDPDILAAVQSILFGKDGPASKQQ